MKPVRARSVPAAAVVAVVAAGTAGVAADAVVVVAVAAETAAATATSRRRLLLSLIGGPRGETSRPDLLNHRRMRFGHYTPWHFPLDT